MSARVRLSALVARELGDAWRERRFVLGGLFCLLLAGAGGFAEASRLAAVRQEEQIFTAGWQEDVRAQALRNEPMEIASVRLASPLTPLANGLDAVLPQRFFSSKERLRFGEARAARSTIEALAGPFDGAYIVAFAFSLLAVVLTYDAISGERAAGTLALLLSYPVSRRQVFAAKAVASILLLWTWLVGALAAIAIAMLVSGLALGDPIRWLLFAALAGLYLAAWTLIALAVSAATPRPAVSLLAALLVWSTLVLIVPRLLPPLLSRGWGHARLVELALLEENESTRLREEYRATVNQLFARFAFAGLGDEVERRSFADQQQAAQADLDRERHELSARIWEEQRRVEAAMERQALWLAALSPTALFQRAAAEVAETGFAERERFYGAARDYYENVGVRIAESNPLFMHLDRNTGSGVALGPSSEEVLTRIEHLLAHFATPWTSLGRTLREVAEPTLLLGLYGLAAALFGGQRLRHLDPRP